MPSMTMSPSESKSYLFLSVFFDRLDDANMQSMKGECLFVL